MKLPLPYRYIDFLTEMGHQVVELELPLRDCVHSFVCAIVTAALLRTNNNKSQAAKMLGIHRNSLIKLIQNMDHPNERISKIRV